MALYILQDGSPSWDGVNPKTKTFCGYAFGYHKEEHRCGGLDCKRYTHYSLHKRYKFAVNLEKAKGDFDWKHNTDRLYVCSEACFQNLILSEMFSMTVPPDIAVKILGV